MNDVNVVARRINKQPQFQVIKPLPVNAELKVSSHLHDLHEKQHPSSSRAAAAADDAILSILHAKSNNIFIETIRSTNFYRLSSISGYIRQIYF